MAVYPYYECIRQFKKWCKNALGSAAQFKAHLLICLYAFDVQFAGALSARHQAVGGKKDGSGDVVEIRLLALPGGSVVSLSMRMLF